jgi:hypothetical protein
VGAVLDRVLCQAQVRLLEAGAARGQLVQQQPVSEGDLADVLRGGPADLEPERRVGDRAPGERPPE